MSNPLVALRKLVAPASSRRTGTVQALAGGWATIAWAGGGTGQVLCGLSVSAGDRVLVIGDAVAAKLPAEATKIVTIL
jgi:hypothetical protein